MISRIRRGARREDGATAVEMALVLPILLLLLFGIISFGILFAQQLALNNGVREGARLAVVEGSASGQTCAGVVTAVRDATGPAIAMNTSAINVTVTRSASSPCGTAANPASTSPPVCAGSINATTNQQQSVVVTAGYRANLVIPMPIPGFPSGFDLTSKAVYKCEFN